MFILAMLDGSLSNNGMFIWFMIYALVLGSKASLCIIICIYQTKKCDWDALVSVNVINASFLNY